MKEFVLKKISGDYISEELLQIGFDESYRFTANDKFLYKNIKIYNLTPAQANIIKQTAISVGADCATHKEVIRGGIEYSDGILGGSISQLKKIAEKLRYQPFQLPKLAETILKELSPQKEKTKIVGILNVTPDSFSDGGKYIKPDDAVKHLIEMIEDGADMIDIGAESTKPYSSPIAAKEQIKRLKPILDFAQKEKIKIPLSIDTRSSEVADFALNSGASIINDVSGFDFDDKMPNVVGKYSAGIIIQHSKGSPENMQNSPEYNNLIDEIFFCLKSKIEIAKANGIKNIIADPGIGFGKTKENNFEILNRIDEFFALKCPIMVGVSRKSLLGINHDDNELKDSLSLAISYPLIQKGVGYLRVHNVKLYKYILDLY